jgi:hypothetical protein
MMGCATASLNEPLPLNSQLFPKCLIHLEAQEADVGINDLRRKRRIAGRKGLVRRVIDAQRPA